VKEHLANAIERHEWIAAAIEETSESSGDETT
jgi:hypothetical protein